MIHIYRSHPLQANLVAHRLNKHLGLLTCLLLLWTIPASAQTIRYVSITGTNTDPNGATSWATSTTNLQGAINSLSATGGEVWVGAGTYKPTTGTNRNVSFSMHNNVTIYGGFPADGTGTLANRQPTSYTTILSGNIGNVNTAGDNSYHVINNPASLSLTNTAILDGFFIVGGNANGTNEYDFHGAGIYNDGSNGSICSPTIRNSSFIDNKANYSGAGIINMANGGISSPIIINCNFAYNTCIYGAAGTQNTAINGGICNPVVTDCIFNNNDGCGVVNAGNYFGGITEPVLTNCSFIDNYGGMRNSGSSPQLRNCNFTHNFVGARGGGIGGGINNDDGSPLLVNCSFTRNVGIIYGGGIYSAIGNPVLVNCRFNGNEGGAIYNSGNSKIKLINCSLSNNWSNGGMAIHNEGGGSATVQLTNCILWNNGGEKTFAGPTPPTVSYSLLEPTVYEYTYTDGGNNLITSTSPFISNTDLQLKAGSPAINAGSNLTYITSNGPTTDLAGNTRIQYGLIDMGAYESAFSSDLNPLLYARPSAQYGTTSFNVVVDVVELNSVATHGSLTVKITKDTRVNLSFPTNATMVGGRTVQNGVWTFTGDAPNYYILSTSQSVAAGDKLSFGLTGVLSPGATGGILAISSTLLSNDMIETSLSNNVDADKVDYFQQ